MSLAELQKELSHTPCRCPEVWPSKGGHYHDGAGCPKCAACTLQPYVERERELEKLVEKWEKMFPSRKIGRHSLCLLFAADVRAILNGQKA